MARRAVCLLMMVLLAATGCLRKDILKNMEERPNTNWMMIGEDMRAGDCAEYCLSEFRDAGGKSRHKHDGQCRKWTVAARDENTVTLQLDILNGPRSLKDIRRTYVVDPRGFIREAGAFSLKTGEKRPIRVAGKGEHYSLERLVPAADFAPEDLDVIDAYSFRKGDSRYLTDEAFGQMEVVPLKAVFTPTEGKQRTEYYLTSALAEFGYVVQIVVVKNPEDGSREAFWVNRLRNTAQSVTAPLP